MRLVFAVSLQSICVTRKLGEQPHACVIISASGPVSLASPTLQAIDQPEYTVPLYDSQLLLGDSTQTIEMAFDDFRSLIYELSSFTLELSRPLDDYGETNPYRIAFMALQGWRHVMTATFEPLFRHHSDQQVARNRQALINTLLHLLPTAWDMASKRSFGLVCSMLTLMVSLPLQYVGPSVSCN